MDAVGVLAERHGIDDDILSFLTGEASYHDDEDFALILWVFGTFGIDERRVNAVGDDMYLCFVSAFDEFVRHELRGRVDVREATV